MTKDRIECEVAVADYFHDFITIIEKNELEILDILCETASYTAASEEIEQSKRVLGEAAAELAIYKPGEINIVSVYHSSNVQLYSYVLYGLIPSMFAGTIAIRPSSRVGDQLVRLHNLLGAPLAAPIEIHPIGQRSFERFSRKSDVVIFTGKYENALEVQQACPNALFLFFGSGLNPVVVTPSADMEKAADDVIRARLFNSGQDCMCPDVIFVDEQKADKFQQLVLEKIAQLRFGPRTDPFADVSPIFYTGVASSVAELVDAYPARVIHKGTIDPQTGVVEPIVIRSNLDEFTTFQELFGPVFNLVGYKTLEDVKEFLTAPEELERAFGLSVYGEPSWATQFEGVYWVVRNRTLFDEENGNAPFGGYGPRASFVSWKGITTAQPILVSREVAHHFGNSTDTSFEGRYRPFERNSNGITGR